MSAPERIWIDVWGGNWSPRGDGTQTVEYLRADLVAQQIAAAEAAAYERALTGAVMIARDASQKLRDDNEHEAVGALEVALAISQYAAAIRARGEE